jgi:hypothetical protein
MIAQAASQGQLSATKSREKRVEFFWEQEEKEDRGRRRRRETNVWSGKSMDRKRREESVLYKGGQED